MMPMTSELAARLHEVLADNRRLHALLDRAVAQTAHLLEFNADLLDLLEKIANAVKTGALVPAAGYADDWAALTLINEALAKAKN